MAVKSGTKQRRKKVVKRSAGGRSAKRGKSRWGIITFGLSAIAVLSATAGALLAYSLSSDPLSQNSLTPEEAAVFQQEKTVSYKNLNIPQLSRPVNILLLGTKVLTSDVGTSSEQGYHALVNSVEGLSDTMLLIRLNPEQDDLVVLSIPRDTQANLPGYGTYKINEANARGGPSLAAESVSGLLGDVPIDRYVRVNVQAVE